MAFVGTADSNGFFNVKDYCYAGIPWSRFLPKQVNLNLKRSLYDDAALKGNKREFVAFISGLEFGISNEVSTIELLLRFFRGDLGSTNT